MNDFVSIVMLTYRKGLNGRDRLSRECIASLLANTSYPYELLLVDNTQNNRGLTNGRNFGAKWATGKYIAFVDDDILFSPGWLEECIRLVEMGDKFIATPVAQYRIKKWELPAVNGVRQNARTGSNCMVMRRSAFEDIGEFTSFMYVDASYDGGKGGKHYANAITKKGYTFLICSPAKAKDLGLGEHSYERKL